MTKTMSKKQWRCYVLGYNRGWADNNRELCERLIKECDFCIDEPTGIAIGQAYSVYTIQAGDNRPIPNDVICVGHEYGGKVVIVEKDLTVI